MILILVIVAGVACSSSGTLLIRNSNGFRRLGPTLGGIACYAGCTWLLAQGIALAPMAIVHVVWAGLTALTLLIVDWVILKTSLSRNEVVGFTFILAGMVVLGAFK